MPAQAALYACVSFNVVLGYHAILSLLRWVRLELVWLDSFSFPSNDLVNNFRYSWTIIDRKILYQFRIRNSVTINIFIQYLNEVGLKEIFFRIKKWEVTLQFFSPSHKKGFKESFSAQNLFQKRSITRLIGLIDSKPWNTFNKMFTYL